MNKTHPSDRRLLLEITPRNLLSYGSHTLPIMLHDLNVLIGPNGSGKSNLIETIALLRASANDLRAIVRQGGGVQEWIWKGKPKEEAYLDTIINIPLINRSLRHLLTFRVENQAFRLEKEFIESTDRGEMIPKFYYRFGRGRAIMNINGEEKRLAANSIESDQSILSQRRDPVTYPEITYLADVYGKIRIYREWAFGRNTIFREPQRADMRTDRLEEDFSNLGLFLNRLRRHPKAKNAILTALKDLYEGIDDFDVSIEGGTVQVFFTEGEYTIPATRLSDGTLHYLCLLAILCDPEPPPLICIEEPELGLHPDILPKIADLLRAAATRTQLIITTHSDILVDAFTDQPEAILVCEKIEGKTTIRRLEQEKLEQWLKDYRLGELWTRGELGGTRW